MTFNMMDLVFEVLAKQNADEVYKSYATCIKLVWIERDAFKRGAAKLGFYMTTRRLLRVI